MATKLDLTVRLKLMEHTTAIVASAQQSEKIAWKLEGIEKAIEVIYMQMVKCVTAEVTKE